MNRIYLDHAAATPLSPAAWMAMEPVLMREFGNPSSIHTEGVRARAVLDRAREQVATCIGAHPDEIVFTSGATESLNLAMFGVLRGAVGHGTHVVTLATEHPSALRILRAAGADVTLVPVDSYGMVRAEDVIAALRGDTVLVSIMMVNNEIGVVQDLADIGRALDRWRKARGAVYPLFITDASQAPSYYAIDADALHIDAAILSSAKVGGPKGNGALFLRRHTPWANIFGGGTQEFGRRPGTENVAGAVGFATALQHAVAARDQEFHRVHALRERLLDGILAISGTSLNGHRIHRSPNSLNVRFADIDGEELVLRLDARGVSVSTGSACHAGDGPSPALLALGLSREEAVQCVRFSLGATTTAEDIARAIEIVREVVAFMKKE